MDEVVKIEFDELVTEKETNLAICIKIGGTEHFIPKSQISTLFEKKNKVYIPEWLAEKKGFI